MSDKTEIKTGAQIYENNVEKAKLLNSITGTIGMKKYAIEQAVKVAVAAASNPSQPPVPDVEAMARKLYSFLGDV